MLRPILATLATAFTLAPHARSQFGPLAELPGDVTVRASAGNQDAPHVAAGAGGFLAVWEDDASSLVDTVFGQQAFGSPVPGNVDVHGMLLDANGARLFDAPLVVAHEAWDQRRPRVAWNGSEYLVVFEGTRPTTSFYSDGIFGVRVSATGVVLDSTPFVIFDSPGFDESTPVVASLGGAWLVAWLDQDPISQLSTVAGRVVNGPTNLGPKLTLVSGTQGALVSELDLAASAGRYALAYSVNFGSGLRARLFDAGGAATTAVITLATSGSRPGIAAGASGFYAAWLGTGGVRGTTLDTAGTLGVAGGTLLAASSLTNNSSVQVAFDGSAYTVGFDAIPSVRVVRVDGAGSIVSGPTVISTTPAWLDDIALAGLSGRTVALWTDNRETPPAFGSGSSSFGIDPSDVWSVVLDAGGAVVPSAPLSVSPPAQIGARVAGDAASGFLMLHWSLSAGRTRLVARRVDAEGRATGAGPFEIASDDRRLIDADIAWNGAEFLVVWSLHRSITFGGTPPLVRVRRCLADGTFLDAAPVDVMEGDSVSVDSVGRTFLVVAHYHHPSLQSNHVVRHRRFDGQAGVFLDGSPVVVHFGQSHDVVGLVDRWFVMRASLGAVVVDLAGNPGPLLYYGPGHRFRLARNPARTEVLLTYERRDASGVHTTSEIRMQRIALDGTALDSQNGLFVSSAPNGQFRPVGVSFGDEYLVAWADHRVHPAVEPGLGDVYACRLDAAGVQLDPAGLAVSASADAEGDVELFASGGGRAIVAFSRITRTGATSGVHRLRTGAYRATPLGTTACTQPQPNSTGVAATLTVRGSSSVADRSLRLEATGLPLNALTLFLVSRNAGGTGVPVGSQGVLCLSGQVGRYVAPGQAQNSGAAGAAGLTVDPLATPTPNGPSAVLAGETWHFQAWHRDAVNGTATSNFTSAVAVTFR